MHESKCFVWDKLNSKDFADPYMFFQYLQLSLENFENKHHRKSIDLFSFCEVWSGKRGNPSQKGLERNTN